MIITAETFKAATGRDPENDDLERCNCHRAGELGHQYCGWNQKTNRPQYEGHPLPLKKPAKYYSLD
jgi:hypothetical protein